MKTIKRIVRNTHGLKQQLVQIMSQLAYAGA